MFVPFVLPGEKISAELRLEKAGFARAIETTILEPSPDRVPAPSPYFQQCGGCQYQHIPYPKQLEFKQQIFRETLQRLGKIELKDDIHVHASPPWNYRNRTRLRVQAGPPFALGYYRYASHDFCAIRECPISSPLINHVLATLLEGDGFGCPPAIDELELFADAADQNLLAWAFCREAPSETFSRWGETLCREVKGLQGITFFASQPGNDQERSRPKNKNTDKNKGGRETNLRNAARDNKNRAQAGPQTKDAGDADEFQPSRILARVRAGFLDYQTATATYRVSAGAFFQVNRHLVDELVSVVTGGAEGQTALDLYAGVGLFSAPLARGFHHIFSVESSQLSFSDLRHNVPASVKAVSARSEDFLRNGTVRNSPDLVVLDPPRAGAGKMVTHSLADLGPRRVRYVSCDPATLARDLAALFAAGYHIEEAHLFDLFPQTLHIESVMLLTH